MPTSCASSRAGWAISVSDHAGRREARLAISELFLDAELDAADFSRLRDRLRESGLTLPELDEVYFDEVAPILYGNLSSVAGVWSGFDAAWLEQQITRAKRHRGIPFVARVRRYLVTRTTIEDWRCLRAMLEG
jgi:hypothetical protein